LAKRGRDDIYRRLDPALVAQTAHRLFERISERFPASGLSRVAAELTLTAEDAGERTRALNRPYYGLRLLIFLVIFGGVAAQVWGFTLVDWSALKEADDPVEFTPVLESALNILLLMAGGVWFLLTLEERVRRNRVQAWLHQLRALAHVIDMHQLTKDPTVILTPPEQRTRASPERTMTRFELVRYLEYCAEMLALNGKLAAVMAGEADDHVIVAAASDVENLCTDLGREVWQKIMILEELFDRSPG
jgi:hypothetical protein